MPVDLPPCACEVCKWLDTPPELRKMSERMLINAIHFDQITHPAVRAQQEAEWRDRKKQMDEWRERYRSQR